MTGFCECVAECSFARMGVNGVLNNGTGVIVEMGHVGMQPRAPAYPIMLATTVERTEQERHLPCAQARPMPNGTAVVDAHR